MPSGTLLLTVVEAKLTRNTEMFGKMDPFVKLKIGGNTFTTKVKDGAGKNPVWNQQFTVAVPDSNGDITLECYDEDVMSNDTVGVTTFPISSLIAKKADWFTIEHKKKSAGQVYLRVDSWTPAGSSSGAKTPEKSSTGKAKSSPGKSFTLEGVSSIVLQVCEAVLTRNTETFGKMDPYAKIEVNG